MLYCWYLRYVLSFRDIEEIMKGRGLSVDYPVIDRLIIKYYPLIKEASIKKKESVCYSWYMDKTYVKGKGQWQYLYRAVDKGGSTIDFLLTSKRNKKTAIRFFNKVISSGGIQEKINIYNSGSNKVDIGTINVEGNLDIKIRQNKYFNNRIEQEYRFIKKVTKYTLGFKNFLTVMATIAGIELIYMLRKRQFVINKFHSKTSLQQFK